MFEPGVGKVAGGRRCDPSWWPKCTAMCFHYWTQPSVNSFSYYLHALPGNILRLFTIGNHIVELILPIIGLLTVILGWCFPGFELLRFGRHLTGIAYVVFQLVLIIGGTCTYLSYLTASQSLCMLDDRFWLWLIGFVGNSDLQTQFRCRCTFIFCVSVVVEVHFSGKNR